MFLQTGQFSLYLHSCNENPINILDPDKQFFASFELIALDNSELTNLQDYKSRGSFAKHICCLCQAEIGTGTSKLKTNN